MDNPEQWHLYVYCANNPIDYTDSSGHKRIQPKTGEKIWFCLKTTKAELRDKIAPYYKGTSTKEGISNGMVRK